MKHLNMPVQSGSEKSITPEERWISTHSTWSDDEAPRQPSTSFAAADDIMEDEDRDEMSLMMMRIQMLPRSQRRTTELWGVSFALFLFGVLMPKGERV